MNYYVTNAFATPDAGMAALHLHTGYRRIYLFSLMATICRARRDDGGPMDARPAGQVVARPRASGVLCLFFMGSIDFLRSLFGSASPGARVFAWLFAHRRGGAHPARGCPAAPAQGRPNRGPLWPFYSRQHGAASPREIRGQPRQ